MEFFLIKAKRGLLFRSHDGDHYANMHLKRCKLPDQPLTLDYVATNCDDGEVAFKDKDAGPSEATSFRSDLMDLLCKNIAIGNEDQLPKSIYLGITVGTHSTTNGKCGLVVITTRPANKIDANSVKKEIPLLDQLMNSGLPPASFGFNLKLKLFLYGTGTANQFEIIGKDLKIHRSNKMGWNYSIGMTDVRISDKFWLQWNNNGAAVEGEVTLTLCLDHCAIRQLYLGRFKNDHLNEWPKKLLADGFGSDLIILAGGEKDKDKGIKSHKFILSDRSPVFKTMFQTGMSEAKENVLEILDMTEAGVRALLQFIYCWDLEEASVHCEMALEMLEAGHKYQMKDLEDAMIGIFGIMPFKWVSVDLAVKLLLFSRNAKLEKTEKKSLEILKWYAQKSESLMTSTEYRKLYLESPRIAMELGQLFLKI